MFSRVCNYFLVFHKTRDPILLIVSYALSISSISYYDLVGIITSWCYKYVKQIEILETADYPTVFILLLGLNLVTECHDFSPSVFHVQYANRLFIDLIGFPYLFELVGSSLTTRLNYFYLEN